MEDERKLADIHFSEAFEAPPFSFALSGNIMSVLKKSLLKEGLRDFPVIALTGPPGSGKTAVARSCKAAESESEYHFYDGAAALKKKLSDPGMQFRYVLIDDLADFNGYQNRQKGFAVMDGIVRGGYNGEMPLMIVTVEEKVLARLTPSCRMRLLEVPVGDMLNDRELTGVLDYLQQNAERLKTLFDEFEKWHECNGVRYSYPAMLQAFRKEHRGRDSRSISLFFMYWLSMQIFNDFLTEAYCLSISMDRIKSNYLEIWERRENSGLTKKDLVRKLFQALIEDGAFQVYEPELREQCIGLCSGQCGDFEARCGPNCYECGNDGKKGWFYDPRALLLGPEEHSVALIESGRYIYQYPPYCDAKTPLLIVRDRVLLALMNDELHKYCIQQRIHLPWLGPKELHQILFEANMCMYNYGKTDHKTYVFDYEGTLCDMEKVMILRLGHSQYEALKETAREPTGGFFADGHKLKHFCRKLNAIGNSIHGMAGE